MIIVLPAARARANLPMTTTVLGLTAALVARPPLVPPDVARVATPYTEKLCGAVCHTLHSAYARTPT